ncbi:EamA family transporter [Trinickia symbiotica]|uniref:EamA family transporter n=1 Tax=Trinickia symbiotica TaxID=863227 RepID=A0A2T3XM30_9BURK|nr:DMT family transporter [Trinickia symbiotica]PTB17497.1 EamA family transporter [Trinickia symbiotica]
MPITVSKHERNKQNNPTRANLLMLFAAMIWGSAFVAQRLSLDVIGPFLFTGLRFLLGSAVVLALCLRPSARASRGELAALVHAPARAWPGALIGVVLSIAIGLQQVGLQYTKVANAGFISSLYVIVVPILGVALGHRTRAATWLGALLAVVGMYLLSVNESFVVQSGDFYQLGCAIIVSLQVLLVGRYARSIDVLALSFVQFATCGFVCLFVALLVEPIRGSAIVDALPTILYSGAFSVGIGYTIQVVTQRDAAPAHAAVIFSMEGVFAALAGWLVLDETLSLRAIYGCALMVAGLIACQCLPDRVQRRAAGSSVAGPPQLGCKNPEMD